MITLGQSQHLPVLKISSPGAIVDAGALGEVLVPHRYCPTELALGDMLRVFTYLDSEGRTIGTTQKPKVEVGQFAFLKAAENTDFGTFMDWGLDKDLLVPFGEQHRPMEAGKSYIVHAYLNSADGRITGSSKIDKFLDDDKPHNFKVGQAVDLIIANSTDLGFKAIIDNSHWGVLYKNEVAERLSFGQSKCGFVKYVRPDRKIDLTLQNARESRDEHATQIMEYLEKHRGFAPLHDKSDPKVIERVFGMSKKSFKRAIGGLYKERAISIESDGIRLLEQ